MTEAELPVISLRYDSLRPGPHLVVLGAVHGDEYCGPQAIHEAAAQLQSQAWPLTRGHVTLVPVCNPRAYARQVRFIERNLNRHLYVKAESVRCHYEDWLDPALCRILDQADALLDLHSYQSRGGAFCFLGAHSQAEIAFTRALGTELLIYGWAEAFGRSGDEAYKQAARGTTDYVRDNGRGAMAATLECGHHHNADAAQTGREGILRALAYLQMTDRSPPPGCERHQQRCIHMRDVYYKDRLGQFTQPWQHGDAVRAGEVIARYDDGMPVTAPYDGVLVLPKASPDLAIGGEWFYFGVEGPIPEAGGRGENNTKEEAGA